MNKNKKNNEGKKVIFVNAVLSSVMCFFLPKPGKRARPPLDCLEVKPIGNSAGFGLTTNNEGVL